MSKVMIANGQMAIVAGTVKAVKDEDEKYVVVLEYDVYDKDTKMTSKKESWIYFRNQEKREDGKDSVPYADRVRKMNLREGSSVITYVRFTDEEHKFANGYSVRYDGALSLRRGDGEDQRLYTVIKGLVTRVTKKQDTAQRDYLSLSVYVGKDVDGNFKNELIHIKPTERSPKLLEIAEKVLSPRADGTKLSAAFLCGEPYEAFSGDGDMLNINTAFDFTVLGQKAVNS